MLIFQNQNLHRPVQGRQNLQVLHVPNDRPPAVVNSLHNFPAHTAGESRTVRIARSSIYLHRLAPLELTEFFFHIFGYTFEPEDVGSFPFVKLIVWKSRWLLNNLKDAGRLRCPRCISGTRRTAFGVNVKH